MNTKIEQRIPVWSALSELFLDQVLQPADHARIAKTLAASPYPEKKIEEILRFEVTPVLRANLKSVAGEWSGFDERWLQERMAPKMDRRALFDFGVYRGIRADWLAVAAHLAVYRKKGV